MPSFTLEYWQLHTIEVSDAENIQAAEAAAKDYFKDQTAERFRFHSIREDGAAQDKKCTGCVEDREEQTGPWKKDRIFVPYLKEAT